MSHHFNFKFNSVKDNFLLFWLGNYFKKSLNWMSSYIVTRNLNEFGTQVADNLESVLWIHCSQQILTKIIPVFVNHQISKVILNSFNYVFYLFKICFLNKLLHESWTFLRYNVLNHIINVRDFSALWRYRLSLWLLLL